MGRRHASMFEARVKKPSLSQSFLRIPLGAGGTAVRPLCCREGEGGSGIISGGLIGFRNKRERE